MPRTLSLGFHPIVVALLVALQGSLLSSARFPGLESVSKE